MYNNYKKLNNQEGIVTMEILIAMAVIVMVISAVILVVFGNQTLAVDTETNHEALYLAQQKIDEARKNSETNFSSVGSESYNFTLDGLTYNGINTVSDISQCLKQITTKLTWTMESRTQYSLLDTMLSSPKEAYALGGDCIADVSGNGEPDWENPDTLMDQDIIPSGNGATDIDVVKINNHKYGFLTSVHSSVSSNDFWVFDLETTPKPTIVGQLNTGPGLNAVDVALNITGDGKNYAFVANNNTTSPYNQLLVIDVTTLNNPSLVAQASLIGVSGTCNASCPQGQTVFYSNKKLYIGTHRTGGAEFHIFDVSAPTTPIELGGLGGLEVNNNINKIIVQGNYAFLVTSDNSEEFMILDVSVPAIPVKRPSFNIPGNSDATSLFVLGGRAYVGKDRENNADDFFVLNITNPLSVSLPTGWSKDFDQSLCDRKDGQGPKQCLGSNTKISDIFVTGNFAFIATTLSTGGFQVWNIKDPSSLFNVSTYNYSEKATGLDFADDCIYISNDSQKALRIIYDVDVTPACQ